MLALCREQRLEHRTKHIALRYFLARELQQRGQLRLAYVASEANTADVFTKALAPCDHQRCCTQLGLLCFALLCLTVILKPIALPPGTRSLDHRLPCLLPVTRNLIPFPHKMVFFGAPKPTSPVHVSATSMKKPPVPSAPKPVIPAEEIQLPLAPHALYAALVSPAAMSPTTVLSSSALDHQVASPAPPAVVLEPLGAAPVQTAVAVHVAASPADDLALEAVSATTGSPAPVKAEGAAI
ncbi:unnamed protein product [Closterium sp. NIES-53]